ncbi:AfsR/SARP family transcriptional regulator [Allokutzneria albata]|nr:transcriptional regulator [Allokutzneria albata]
MDFRVLGALEIIGPRGRVELGAPKQRALTAALLCRAGQAFSTDALIGALWGDNPPRSARKNIQVYVYQVRKAFAAAGAPDRLHLEHAGYRLVVNPGELDIDRFNELFARGRTELTSGEAERAARTLRDSMSLWRGEPFADLPDVEFLNRQADAWRERRLAAVEARIEADLRAGRHADVVDELFCLVRAHPLHEQFRAQLMTALLLGERKTEALAVYDHGRQLLASELGIAPGANLTRAHQAVLSGKAPGFPTDPGARPRRTVPKKIVPRQLPRGLSDFVGRQAQLTALGNGLARAASGGWPLLVLTGAAGVGKSALAIKAAHLAAPSFPDGQLYIDLAEHNGGEALGQILRALGCAPAELPADPCERQALYRTLVADRSVLVVLDNAANESQVRSLLPGSPRSAAIVTARSRLLGLDSAELVELGGFRSGESAQVLLGRTEAVAEDAQYAEFIADTCDHLPVAVRIAAVRASGRSLQETARRLISACNPLDELVAGDESVRARLTSCYAELDLIGKTALRRLGTLGSAEFTVAALASLLGTSTGHAERSLDQLLDRHLVSRIDDAGGTHRFALSRLTHHFAMELARDPALPRVS